MSEVERHAVAERTAACFHAANIKSIFQVKSHFIFASEPIT